MTPGVAAVAMFVAGCGVGVLVAWLFARQRAQLELQRVRGESAAELRQAQVLLGERSQQLADQARRVEAEIEEREVQNDSLQEQVVALSASVARLQALLEQEREASKEKLAIQDEARQRMTEAFRAVSADALQTNNQQFLDLARTQLERFQSEARLDLEGRQKVIADTMTPIRESLGKVDAQIQQLERARVGAYESLSKQVEQLNADQRLLRGETSNLVSALRQPTVRGRWGEIQLRRVVELAGMLNYCDFFEQESVATEEGRLRPDLVVRLPGGRSVVIDSKVPLASYLAALEAKDDASRAASLAQHARQVRAHIGDLARKGYAAEVRQSAEFVVLFLPGEVFFSAALEQDPGLIEAGVDDGIVIATPTSLIALLRAVARGWRNEQVARNAEQISTLGKELYERLAKLGEHWGRVGKNLRQAVDSFNAASGSLEGRVMVTARRFRELDGGLDGEAIEVLSPVDVVPRVLQDPDLLRLPVDVTDAAVVDAVATPQSTMLPAVAQRVDVDPGDGQAAVPPAAVPVAPNSQ